MLIERGVAPKHQAGRIKQWLHLLRRRHDEAVHAHQRLRMLIEVPALLAGLRELAAEGAAGSAEGAVTGGVASAVVGQVAAGVAGANPGALFGGQARWDSVPTV
jgi:hypothetical protein